jgi:predicted nucleic acid-binding OB-fold protein
MKKENSVIRKAMMETSKNYVEVVNENLALRRKLEELELLANRLFPSKEDWNIV